MDEILEITSRQFREEQRKYFDLADNGTQIVLKRGRKKAYVLIPLDDEDMYFTPTMLEKIERSLEQAKTGNVTRVTTKEELKSFLDGLHT